MALAVLLSIGTACASRGSDVPATLDDGGIGPSHLARRLAPDAAPAPTDGSVTATGPGGSVGGEAGRETAMRTGADPPAGEGAESNAAAPSYITGLTVPHLERMLSRHGVRCARLEPATGLRSWRCSGATPDGRVGYDVTVDGADENRIAIVTALVTHHAEPDAALTARFLGDVASLPWKGSEPGAARSWVDASLPGAVAGEVTTRIGHAMLILGGSEESVTLDVAALAAASR